MLEKGIFGRALQIFLIQPVEFALAGLLAVIVSALTLGLLAGPALGGLAAMALRRSRGEAAEITDLLRGFERFTATIPVGLAVGVMVLLGSALMLVPGLILGATYFMALPLCIDRGLGAAAAMAEARRLATGDLLSVVILFSGALVLGASGLVLLVAGLCVTVPLAVIALVLLYREASEAAATDRGPAEGAPPA